MPTFISAPHIRHPAGRLKAMRINPAVAITIDTEGFPPDVLLVRGRAEVTEVDGVHADYALSARRYLGEHDAEEYLRQINHPSTRMARISVRPTWVGVVDFRSRPPGPLGGPQPGATNGCGITSADRELHPPVRRQRTSAGRPERGHSVGRGSATSVGSPDLLVRDGANGRPTAHSPGARRVGRGDDVHDEQPKRRQSAESRRRRQLRPRHIVRRDRLHRRGHRCSRHRPRSPRTDRCRLSHQVRVALDCDREFL